MEDGKYNFHGYLYHLLYMIDHGKIAHVEIESGESHRAIWDNGRIAIFSCIQELTPQEFEGMLHISNNDFRSIMVRAGADEALIDKCLDILFHNDKDVTIQ